MNKSISSGNFLLLKRIANGENITLPAFDNGLVPEFVSPDGKVTPRGRDRLRSPSPQFPALGRVIEPVCGRCGFETPLTLCVGGLRMIWRFLFGRDDDEAFDVISYNWVRMGYMPLWCRFQCRFHKPQRAVHYWMSGWDVKFRLRYFDIHKAAHPERYIQ